MRKTIQEIKEANRQKKETAFFMKIARPIGHYTAWFFIRLNLTPLMINYANFALANLICLMFAWTGSSGRIAAATLLVLWEIMDTTDGNMARTLKIRSNYGGFIDFTNGMFLIAFLQFSIGLGLYFHPEHSLERLFERAGIDLHYLPIHSLIFGAYSSLSATLNRLVYRISQIRFGKEIFKEYEAGFGGLSLTNKIIWIIRDIEYFGGFQIPLIFLGAVSGCLEFVVLFYFVVNLMLLVGWMTKAFISLRHSHEYLKGA